MLDSPRRRGNRVVVATSGHSWMDDSRVHQRCAKILARNGYEVLQIGPYGADVSKELNGVKIIGFAPRKSLKIIHRWKPLFQLFRLLWRYKAPVIHCHEIDAIFAGLIIKIFRGSKLVYDCHEMSSRTFSVDHFPTLISPFVFLFIRSIEYFLFLLSDGLVAASDDTIDQFSRKRTITRLVLPNYPSKGDTEIAKRPSTSENKNMFIGIFVGTLDVRRGNLEILTALKHLKELNFNQIRIKFVGSAEKDFLEKMLNYIRENELTEWATYEKEVPYLKMWEKFALADFGFILDHPIPENLNNLASKFLEYLSAGLPVLANDLPINREMMNKFKVGILTPSLKPEDIAQSLIKMTEMISALGFSLNLHCRKVFEDNLCFENQEGKLLRLYETLLKTN